VQIKSTGILSPALNDIQALTDYITGDPQALLFLGED
jgi:hypothetical protein